LSERRGRSGPTGPDPEAWGVVTGFKDAYGAWREAPAATVDAVLAAMDADGPGPAAAPVITVRVDRPSIAIPAGTLHLEDGRSIGIDGRLPAGVPPGYHRLHPADGPPVPLIASPGRCQMPPAPEWGFAAQLYATRSARSWGMGDLGDLRRLGEWSASLGARVAVINPLHAAAPTSPQEPSPYFPGSRCFLNPIYLAVEEIHGAAHRPSVSDAAAAGQALNRERLVDRDKVWALKSAVLEQLFEDFAGDDDFDAFQAERGAALISYATFCALAERYGTPWQSWPARYGRPDSPAVRQFTGSPEGARRMRYHAWLQWTADRQLRRAARATGVVQDLAVGVDPGGADAWGWQNEFAIGMRVGAPPDRYNTRGQDWSLPPFDPWKLRAAGYRPWIESLRGTFRHGAGLRVDHVMGLFRLYWIPAGASPAEGLYVRYPHRELLDILALEAHRAGAFVVGEDLGTVEHGVRRELSGRNVLSYRVWWFEKRRPAAWPKKALGAMTTHDLPTVAGVLTGSDLEAQRRLGMEPNEEAEAGLRAKLRTRAGAGDGASAGEVVAGAYEDLAAAPCIIVTATLDDVVAVEERPNMPGTVDEWPNWRLALPLSIEQIEQAPLPRRIAQSLNSRSSNSRNP
jgi:4-alpha-glucanotransferase